MWVIYTDLDGTLLDHHTYSFEAARPALERIARLGVPLVLCTSKTRAEIEVWRAHLDIPHPFISENGGGVFVPRGYFPFPAPRATHRGDYEVVEFGDRYADLAATLAEAERASGASVRAFHRMSSEEVAESCGLPLDQAELAKAREYDEPFEILDPRAADRLLAEIDKRGKRWTRGGRFYHITGNNDKSLATLALTEMFRRLEPDIITIGLGDGLNDAGMLNVVDRPIIIRSSQAAELQEAVPTGRITDESGPAGWNRAILEMIPE